MIIFMAQLIPKEKAKPPPILNALFCLSIIALILAIFLYLWLGAKNSKLRKEIQELKDSQLTLASAKNQETERQVREVGRKIDDFRKIFSEHKFASRAFQFLENNLHPKVQLLELTLTPDSSRLTFSGRAESIRAVGEQLLALRANQSIKDITLSGPSLDEEGDVKFGMTLSLKPEIFTGFKHSEEK